MNQSIKQNQSLQKTVTVTISLLHVTTYSCIKGLSLTRLCLHLLTCQKFITAIIPTLPNILYQAQLKAVWDKLILVE